MQVAQALGQPLLISGEPGTGKTLAAYYAASLWNYGEVLHFQVKSDSTARDLLYHFDAVGYFREAHLAGVEASDRATARQAFESPGGRAAGKVDKAEFLERRVLWDAFDESREGRRRVVLIDEIDKAPRDFPNDLLHELDRHEFEIRELPKGHAQKRVCAQNSHRPVVFITTNSERKLPEPFLRRCVYHHIEYSPELLKRILEKRRAREFPDLAPDLVATALRCFQELRGRGGRPLPSTAEFLCWLRMVAHAAKVDPALLGRIDPQKLRDLPFKGLLLKDATRQKEFRAEKL